MFFDRGRLIKRYGAYELARDSSAVARAWGNWGRVAFADWADSRLTTVLTDGDIVIFDVRTGEIVFRSPSVPGTPDTSDPHFQSNFRGRVRDAMGTMMYSGGIQTFFHTADVSRIPDREARRAIVEHSESVRADSLRPGDSFRANAVLNVLPDGMWVITVLRYEKIESPGEPVRIEEDAVHEGGQ